MDPAHLCLDGLADWEAERVPIMQVCPFHGDEAIRGRPLGDDAGTMEFTCARRGHPEDRLWVWTAVPEPLASAGANGLAAELGLSSELPHAVATYGPVWVEYGLIERAYAQARSDDFAELVTRYGHTHLGRFEYTVSKYLGGVLGQLARVGTLLYRGGPGTGRWSYNRIVGYYALPSTAPSWEDRLSWEQAGAEVDYLR